MVVQFAIVVFIDFDSRQAPDSRQACHDLVCIFPNQ